ncbi:MAG TPA: molybdenum cofactor biosynthesis protein MoaE, partial [Cellvibrionaceae bacterium]
AVVPVQVRIQTDDFSVAAEYEALNLSASEAGAVVFFTGRVRPDGNTDPVIALELEHYPAMTEQTLNAIAEQAAQRWQVDAIRVIHRVGKLATGEQIVYVGVAARHRAAAFSCAEYMMDYLKTRAPFWKKAWRASGAAWVEAKEDDHAACERWQD